MKKYLYLVLFTLLLSACGQNPGQQPQSPSGAENTFTAYAGTYSGILPCASCEGIDTELTLSPDGTFSLIEFYLSKESDLYLTEGTWKLSDDLTHAVLSPADPNESPLNLFYTLKGIDLVKLDIHARPIESSLNYTLRRK